MLALWEMVALIACQVDMFHTIESHHSMWAMLQPFPFVSELTSPFD
jgi:hypothetical protein